MEAQTLVLAADYTPVGRVSWQRALTLYFSGKCEVIDEYQDRDIRAATLVIKMPSVVRFLRALRSKRKVVKFSRLNVYTRDEGRCQFCREKVPLEDTTYDHIVPRSKGGQTNWENVVIACMPCNQKKGNKTLEQAGMTLAKVPVRPKKLPDYRVRLTWRKGMPEAWTQWLQAATDAVYWNGTLDED